MTYDEAMERFGHDAPDLRFGMELTDCTDLAKEAEFRVFRETAEAGGRVRGINAKGAAAQFSRKRLDELTDWVKMDFGAKGLVWFRVEENGALGRRSPRISADSPVGARSASGWAPQPGDLLLFVADTWEVTCKALAALRKRLGAELKLYDPRTHEFLVGRRVPDVRVEQGRTALGRHASSVHGAAAAGSWNCWRRSRPSAGRRLTIW